MDNNKFRTIQELYIFEGNITWNRYNVMLLANSIILGGIALLLTGAHLFLPLVLVFGGILTCLVWYRLTIIGFGMFEHYFNEALKCESKLENHEEKVLTNAGAKSWGCWDVLKCAKAVIWIFLVIYGFVAMWLTIKIFCATKFGRGLIS